MYLGDFKSKKLYFSVVNNKPLSFVLLFFSLGYGLMSQSILTHVIDSGNGLMSSEVYCVFEFDNRLHVQNGQYMSIWNGREFEHTRSDSLGIASYYLVGGFLGDSLVVLRQSNHEKLCLYDGKTWDTVDIPSGSRHSFWYLYLTDSLVIYDRDGGKHKLNRSLNAFEKVGQIEMPPLRAEEYVYRVYLERNKKWLYGFQGDDRVQQKLYIPESLKWMNLDGIAIFATNEYGSEVILNREGIRYLHSGKVHQFNSPAKTGILRATPMGGDSSMWVRNAIDNSNQEIYHLSKDSLIFLGNTTHSADRPIRTNTATGYGYDCSHSGVFRRNPYVAVFTKEDGDIIDKVHTIVKGDNGEIIVGGYGSGLNRLLPQDRYSRYEQIQSRFTHILPGGLYNEGKYYFFTQQATMLFSLEGNATKDLTLEFEDGSFHKKAGYIIKTLKEGKLAFGLEKNGLAIADTIIDDKVQSRQVSKDKGMLLDNVLGLADDHAGRVWVGRSKQGISIYDVAQDTAYSYMKIKENPDTYGAMAFAHDMADCMWIGTEQGLFAVRKASSFDLTENLFEFAERVHLPNDNQSFITSLYLHQDSILVVGSADSQLSFVDVADFHDLGTNRPYSKQLHFGEDIPGEGVEQNCITQGIGNEIWVDVQNAVLKINMDFWDKRGNGQFELISLSSGSDILDVHDDKVHLDASSPTLTCTYGFLGEAIGDHIRYDILLANSDGDTLYNESHVTSHTFTTEELESGDYTLSIVVIRNNVEYHREDIDIGVPYEIPTNALLGLAVLFFLTTLLVGVIFYIKQKENIATQNRLISELSIAKLKGEKEKQEVQSLLAALNPHFIYNSLNWIQGRYKKDQEFSKVVGRLSDNIRLIFSRAREGRAYHSLQEEILFLERYLDIQRVRYADNHYNYILPDPHVLNSLGGCNVLIMQFQLLFENAIEHGLRNRAEANEVRLTLTEQDDYIVAKIIDDGVGYTNAKAMNSHGTQQGTKMIRKLYEIFNTKNTSKYEMTVEDNIYNDKGDTYGTCVTILIPKKYSYEL